MDLVSVIIDLWDASPFKPKLEHVYGHSEDIVPSIDQTPIQQLNNRMDKRAKEICRQHLSIPGHRPPTFHHLYGMGSILCHQHYISSSLASNLYDHILHAKFVAYLAPLFNVPTNILQTHVAWEPFRRARHRAQFGLFKFVSKIICGDLAVGVTMVKRRHRH